ncbi:MAG: peptidylprolyl isomerase [Acidobacteria bacterium]|nr:peptidylprolyl isomerase [Acidobacteriota bacterium]
MKRGWLCALLMVVSCHVGRDTALATYDGGSIDDDMLMRSLMQEALTQDASDWHNSIRERLRQMVVDRALRETVLRQSDLAKRLGQVKNQWLRTTAMERLIAETAEQLPEPDDRELHAAFDAAKAHDDRVRRRTARHIFKRRLPGVSDEALMAIGNEIRARIQSGEAFVAVAAETSDSQSRHFSGNLGWFREDDASDLAKTVFGLQLGVLSKPIVTAEGVHLFEVTDERVPEPMTFESRRNEWIVEAKRASLINAVRERLQSASATYRFELDADEIESGLQNKRDDVVVMSAQDFVVTIGNFRTLRQPSNQLGLGSGVRAILDYLDLRERAVQWYLDRMGEPDRIEMERVEWDIVRRLGMPFLVGQLLEEETLKQFYLDHQQRFTSHVELQLVHFKLPIADLEDVNQTMAELEAFHDAPHSLEDFHHLQAVYGGEITDLGWANHQVIGSVFPAALNLVLSLKSNETSPPILDRDAIIMMFAVARKEPEIKNYEDSVDEVRQMYMNANAGSLERAAEAKLLASVHITINQSRVDAFVRAMNTPGLTSAKQ